MKRNAKRNAAKRNAMQRNATQRNATQCNATQRIRRCAAQCGLIPLKGTDNPA
jgi:hypothetical protein